ncbi:MAG: SagB/ThcOx family dehydrogenase [Chloroflexota bacterium]
MANSTGQPKSNRTRFWFVNDEDLATTPSTLYHEFSKLGEFRITFAASLGESDPKRSEAMVSTIKEVSGKKKSYDYLPKYKLVPSAWEDLTEPFGSLLQNRRTRRKFQDGELSATLLATLLLRGAGLNGELRYEDGTPLPLRTYPSGGALYPLEIYPILLQPPVEPPLTLPDNNQLNNQLEQPPLVAPHEEPSDTNDQPSNELLVTKMPQGLYHLDIYESALSLLSEGDYRSKLKEAFIGDTMMDNAAAVLVITALFPRNKFKYGERGYRFALMEAGHLAQNLILTGQALGLSVVPMGGFLDRRLENLLEVDGVEESVIYPMIIGI